MNFIQAVTGSRPPVKDATTNPWGDIVCPYCDTLILTPLGGSVSAGHRTCKICKLTFVVTDAVADDANRNAAKHGSNRTAGRLRP